MPEPLECAMLTPLWGLPTKIIKKMLCFMVQIFFAQHPGVIARSLLLPLPHEQQPWATVHSACLGTAWLLQSVQNLKPVH